jgi:hypothetical protein
LACFITFFLLALEATEFTDLGIFRVVFVAGDPSMPVAYQLADSLRPDSMVNNTYLLPDLFQSQLLQDTVSVCRIHKGGMRKFKLALLRFLCKNMALKSVLSFDFSGTCKLKPLLGTGFCLHFRHFLALY